MKTKETEISWFLCGTVAAPVAVCHVAVCDWPKAPVRVRAHQKQRTAAAVSGVGGGGSPASPGEGEVMGGCGVERRRRW